LGLVRWDLCAAFGGRPDGEAPLCPDELAFAAATTFAPKNLRISASLSRCCTDIESKDEMSCVESALEGLFERPTAELRRKSGYLRESSASACSRSCASSFFSFAFCFLSAFFSVLDVPWIGVWGLVAGVKAGDSFFFFFLDYHKKRCVLISQWFREEFKQTYLFRLGWPGWAISFIGIMVIQILSYKLTEK
jgi:hypothetical protein